LDWKRLWTGLKGLRRYWSGYRQVRELNSGSGESWKLRPSYPCLEDYYGPSGVASGHYFHQDLHVAQRIFLKCPVKHLDVGSRVDGFVAHVASFREIEFMDLKPINFRIPNIRFHCCDLLNLSPNYWEFCDSLSCLHVLEHIGLGRYGDRIVLNGYIPAFENLVRMLKTGGTLYLSVPFGSPAIEYNAHRIFDLRTIRELIEKHLTITEFSLVNDAGELETKANLREVADHSTNYCYALAIFESEKR
jgi:Caenorhabditis protein of unknown function, DUF268